MITENRAKEREHEAYLRGVRVASQVDYGWNGADVAVAAFVAGVIAFAAGIVLGMLIVGSVQDFVPGCPGWPSLFTPVGWR